MGGVLLGAVPQSSDRLSSCRSPAARKRKLVPNGPQAKRTAASSSSESSSEEEEEAAAPPAKKPGEGGKGPRWVGNLTLLWIRRGACGSGEVILLLSGSRLAFWS